MIDKVGFPCDLIKKIVEHKKFLKAKLYFIILLYYE